MFFKTGVLRNVPIFTGKYLSWSHSLIKLQVLWPGVLTQVFSCEYCELFTKSFSERKPPVASVNLLFLTKSNVEWFLLKSVDLFIVRVIYTNTMD